MEEIKKDDVVRIKANEKLMIVTRVNDSGYINGFAIDKHGRRVPKYIRSDKVNKEKIWRKLAKPVIMVYILHQLIQ